MLARSTLVKPLPHPTSITLDGGFATRRICATSSLKIRERSNRLKHWLSRNSVHPLMSCISYLRSYGVEKNGPENFRSPARVLPRLVAVAGALTGAEHLQLGQRLDLKGRPRLLLLRLLHGIHLLSVAGWRSSVSDAVASRSCSRRISWVMRR